jgi:3-oxoacyl-(acyl-carrier-protein) synthase
MLRNRRVLITGMGLLCPMGDSSRALYDGLCREGAALAGPLVPEAPEAHLGDHNAYPLDRPARLLAATAGLALADGGWTPEGLRRQDVGLFVGTFFSTAHTISRFDCQAVREGPSYASPLDFANTVINAPAGQAAIWHGLRGMNKTIATGASSGLEAIGCASLAVRIGRADCLLAGGVEELSVEATRAFGAAGLLCGAGERPLPFDAGGRGLALSEGAALLVLEEAEFALRRGARVLAEVRGHGHAFDTSRRRDERCSVRSIARAMHAAIQQADLGPEDVDVICASANGTAGIDRHEALAITALFEERPDAPTVSAIKGLLGESLGAAGPLQCVAMVEALRAGLVPAALQLRKSPDMVVPCIVPAARRRGSIQTCLINALGLDGHSCSLVLTSVAA